ncbi:hypothetical protein [Nonomuraea salmonea]|uniref:ParB/Sulfiredoxin domain-containing protein n=1 Tax=Nonomuraea salmonea TaxID=46181 RepID=A0ABV5P4N3_9ACTN
MSDDERLPPERIADLGNGLELWRVHVDDLFEQELNAQAMPAAMFERLSATIGRDARLESLPFCALVGDGDRLEIVSGHHRTRAARAAGVHYVFVLVDVTGLTPDQIKAKQLAHNALHGESEEQLVARIYAQIKDVDARLEAYVSPPDVEIVPPRVSLPNIDLDVEFRTTLITFMPHQADKFERAVEQLIDQADLDRDHLYLVDKQLYEQWQAVTRRLRREYDARALSTVMSRLIDATAEVLGIDSTDPADLDPSEHKPLAELLGTALVDPGTAALIETVVDAAIDAKTVTKSTRSELIGQAFKAYAAANRISLACDLDDDE